MKPDREAISGRPSVRHKATATPSILNAQKSWVTSASRATAYVWSSKPLQAEGAEHALAGARRGRAGSRFKARSRAWACAAMIRLPSRQKTFESLATAMLGGDGKGFDIMMGIVLPVFNVLNAACSVGLMEAAVRRTAEHASGTRHSDTGATLADLPTIRNYIARMRVKTDMARTLLDDTIAAMGANRGDTMLRVLECKAAAGETATEVLDLAMRVCGGAAFRKDVAVERYFRDARAAGVMAPTTDVLYDFIGKAVCGLPLF